MTTADKCKFVEYLAFDIQHALMRSEDVPEKADVVKLLVTSQAVINTRISHLIGTILQDKKEANNVEGLFNDAG